MAHSSSPAEQIAIVKRGADELLVEEEFTEKLKLGRPLRVKLGMERDCDGQGRRVTQVRDTRAAVAQDVRAAWATAVPSSRAKASSS